MIQAKLGLSGKYKLEVVKASGEVRQTLEFDNLITNQGLDLFSGSVVGYTGNLLYSVCHYKCYVGSGSTAPAVTDTALDAEIANQLRTAAAGTVDVGLRTYTIAHEYTFATGAAAGNLSEVGVGADSTQLFSRSLIKDGNGAPTTITILVDEVLRVTYSLVINVPTATYLFSSGGYDFELKACNADTGPYIYGLNDDLPSRITYPRAYTGAIGVTIDDAPSGGNGSITSTVDTYTLGSYTRTGTLSAGLTEANFDVGSFRFGFGPLTWQLGALPVLPKDDTQILEIGVQVTWAREGELPP